MPPEKGAETEGTLPFARLWMAQSAGSMESRTAKQLRPIAQGCVATLGNGSDPNVDNPKGVGFIEIEIESHVLSISIAIPISIWIIPIFGSRFPGSRSYPGKVFGPIMAEPLQGSVGVLRIPDSRGSCATPGYRTLPLRGNYAVDCAFCGLQDVAASRQSCRCWALGRLCLAVMVAIDPAVSAAAPR